MWATKYGITIHIDLYSTVLYKILGWKGGIQMEWGRGMSEATAKDIPYIKKVYQRGQFIMFSVVFTPPHPPSHHGQCLAPVHVLSSLSTVQSYS
jgi:hypothetical protein